VLRVLAVFAVWAILLVTGLGQSNLAGNVNSPAGSIVKDDSKPQPASTPSPRKQFKIGDITFLAVFVCA
jgi:hypothetical protein